LLGKIMMAEAKWLILFGIACYGFGALSVTADELYGIAQFYGTGGVYYFPIIGARGLWDAWVYVFTGLGICFFLGALSVLMLQRTKPTRREPRSRIQSQNREKYPS
jgi:hypothetical protein